MDNNKIQLNLLYTRVVLMVKAKCNINNRRLSIQIMAILLYFLSPNTISTKEDLYLSHYSGPIPV